MKVAVTSAKAPRFRQGPAQLLQIPRPRRHRGEQRVDARAGHVGAHRNDQADRLALPRVRRTVRLHAQGLGRAGIRGRHELPARGRRLRASSRAACTTTRSAPRTTSKSSKCRCRRIWAPSRSTRPPTGRTAPESAGRGRKPFAGGRWGPSGRTSTQIPKDTPPRRYADGARSCAHPEAPNGDCGGGCAQARGGRVGRCRNRVGPGREGRGPGFRYARTAFRLSVMLSPGRRPRSRTRASSPTTPRPWPGWWEPGIRRSEHHCAVRWSSRDGHDRRPAADQRREWRGCGERSAGAGGIPVTRCVTRPEARARALRSLRPQDAVRRRLGRPLPSDQIGNRDDQHQPECRLSGYRFARDRRGSGNSAHACRIHQRNQFHNRSAARQSSLTAGSPCPTGSRRRRQLVSVGYILGFLAELSPETRIGASYRSQISHRIEGIAFSICRRRWPPTHAFKVRRPAPS